MASSSSRAAKEQYRPAHGRRALELSEIALCLNVSAERARQVANDDPTFPAPVSEQPRRWSRAKVERWAERHWWETRPWRKRL